MLHLHVGLEPFFLVKVDLGERPLLRFNVDTEALVLLLLLRETLLVRQLSTSVGESWSADFAQLAAVGWCCTFT